MENQKYNIGDLVKINPIYYTLEHERDNVTICIILDYLIQPFEHYILTNLFDDDRLVKFNRTKEFVERYYDPYKT
jgi:hypothetical protein